MRSPSLLLVALLVSAGVGAPAFAGPADLDPTFGTGGSITVPLAGSGVARAVVIQPDGKIVAAGNDGVDSVLVRVDGSGVLDPSFGTGGIVITDFSGSGTDRANAVVRQPDGKIVTAGEITTFGTLTVLARYGTNGAPDPSFGSGGTVLTVGYIARALVLQSDGLLVAGGPGASSGFTVVRYAAGGAVDGTFGNSGVAVAFAGSPNLELYALVLQPDGKIVAIGGGDETVALARFNDDGTLDGTFGTGGEVTTPITIVVASSTTAGEARAVALQPDGSIVVAATAKGFILVPNVGIVNLSEAQMLRYADDGSLDATFGSGGVVALHQSLTSAATADAVVVQPDGKLVAAGWKNAASQPQSHFLVRVTSTGQPDASFTSDSGTPPNPGRGNALALQSDRKLIVAGFGGVEGASSFQIQRFQGGTCGDGVLDGAEGCDDGNVMSGDGCDANCTPTGCGNGIITAGEQCEEAPGNCCGATCQYEPAATPCAGDGDACSNHACDAGGTCLSTEAPAATCAPTISRRSFVKITRISDAAKRAVQWAWKGTGVSVSDFDDPRDNPVRRLHVRPQWGHAGAQDAGADTGHMFDVLARNRQRVRLQRQDVHVFRCPARHPAGRRQRHREDEAQGQRSHARSTRDAASDERRPERHGTASQHRRRLLGRRLQRADGEHRRGLQGKVGLGRLSVATPRVFSQSQSAADVAEFPDPPSVRWDKSVAVGVASPTAA